MDILTLLLVVLILAFLFGGLAWPRPETGPAPVNSLLYILAFVVILVVLLRLLGVLI